MKAEVPPKPKLGLKGKIRLIVGRGRTDPGLHLLDRSRCIRYHERMKTELSKAHALLCG